MTLTLLAVHAHPDDEATGTGGVYAKAAAEGVRTVLVTCTDGRCGDGPGGVKPGEPGHEPEAVAAVRTAELERSTKILGIDVVERLGYHDSGMMGWPDNDLPGAFWTAPFAEATDRLAALLRTHRPDVVVTYDENGVYGHPDHIQANRVTMAALDLLAAEGWQPAKVYWSSPPYSQMKIWGELVREFGTEAEQAEMAREEAAIEAKLAAGERLPMGLPDDELTTWVDVKAYGQAKFEALSAHGSQSDSAMFLGLGVERFTGIMGVETFQRVRDTTGAPTPEADLFDGLR
ncbi:PIG-L family deacetylase [Kineosporia sp. J2-2]|uniref:PIG-L family deacetylase n=1 Tax=Kineosporia corallincola TaxID=2835133 RepID=A0ABS5TKU6_9ACTN|nr:PIG-L family deacetylase [Kineosporia corallincola]MBT0771725.1 PIG-L family deacetylase [Kineosporia corallincola]